MEADLGIPTALFAPPVREVVEVGQSQIGFINIFAYPLFQAVADIMPAMGFCVEELERNRGFWEEKISVEQAKITEMKKRRGRRDSDDSMAREGEFSPRHLSMALAGATMVGESAEEGAEEGKGGGGAEGRKSITRPALPSGLRNASSAAELDSPSEASRPVTGTAAERRSETTEGSTSASTGVPTSASDWASQATGKTEGEERGRAAEASCASTRGTSVGSCEDKAGAAARARGAAKASGAARSSSSPDLRHKGSVVRVVGEGEAEGEAGGEAKGARESIVTTMRSLARKPSRNRFRFWKKRGAGAGAEAAPPLPVSAVLGPPEGGR